MIKVPFTPWTPPIRITKPKPPKQEKPKLPESSGGQSGGQSSGQSGGQSSGQSGESGSPAPQIPTIEELFSELLQTYLPETIDFTPLSEEVLSETIRNWLRPAYEQAIAGRREQTGRINAELDADAWSRGMGNSTYLTDVKERQFRNESRDVDALESDYASTLAGHLYDAMKEQQDKKIEVDEFNAEAINRAREKAMEAARALYQTYLTGARSSGTGSSGAASAGRTEADAEETETQRPTFLEALLAGMPADLKKTDYRTAASILARMSSGERARLYNRTDPAFRDLRNELLISLGNEGFQKLMQDYPA